MKTAYFKTFKMIGDDKTVHRMIQYTNPEQTEAIKDLCSPSNPFDLIRARLGMWIWEIPNTSPRDFRWVSDTFVRITFKEGRCQALPEWWPVL